VPIRGSILINCLTSLQAIWYHGNQPLDMGQVIGLKKAIIISSVTPANDGVYTCYAKYKLSLNLIGTSRLNVIGKSY